ncbi:MAG: hypothetical protein ACYS32_14295, partial [Planctomycetota bacterium]
YIPSGTIKARKNRAVWAETAGFASLSKIGLTVHCMGIILARLTRSKKRRFIVGAENGQK